MLFNLKNQFDMPCWNLIRTQTHSTVPWTLNSTLNIWWTRDEEIWVSILQNWWTNPSLSINFRENFMLSCISAPADKSFFPPWNEATLFHHSGVEWRLILFPTRVVWGGKLRQPKSVEQRTFRQLIQSYTVSIQLRTVEKRKRRKTYNDKIQKSRENGKFYVRVDKR